VPSKYQITEGKSIHTHIYHEQNKHQNNILRVCVAIKCNEYIRHITNLDEGNTGPVFTFVITAASDNDLRCNTSSEKTRMKFVHFIIQTFFLPFLYFVPDNKLGFDTRIIDSSLI
jgi:hypothetical protein